MTDSLEQLATAAGVGGSYGSRRSPPAYSQIVSAAAVLRLFSFICIAVSILLILAGVAVATLARQNILRTIDSERNELERARVESREARSITDISAAGQKVSSLESVVSGTTLSANVVLLLGCGVSGLGIVSLVASTALGLFAWIALAVRDIARNSYR